jgi:glycosyltransferase involved in cell wall biosynthesis
MLVTPSGFLRDKVIAGGYSPEKVVHIPNMVPVENYSPHPEPGDYVLFAGRLSHEKGLYVLLEAFRYIAIPLRIAGTGPEMERAGKLVEEHDMRHVHFEGYCSGEKLKNLYRQSAFSVIPSTCYENCPMSVIEAMAYAKPVLGAQIGGIPELVTDGLTGRLSPPGDSDALRETVNKLWNNRSQLREMGHEARKKACELYSPRVHYEQLYDIYLKALS